MAKARKNLKSTLGLGRKLDIKQRKIIKKDIDKIAEKLVENNVTERKESTKRLSIDVPESMYKVIKMKVFTDGQTVRSYILDLINKDINSLK